MGSSPDGTPGLICAMTGIPLRDSGEGIWDDGEWISLEYINRHLEPHVDVVEEDDFDPTAQPEGWELLKLIERAKRERPESKLWGQIGELYVAERFGVVLSRPHAQGHDGRLGNELVEVKTISPRKERAFVRVKRAGNFSLLAVVRVDPLYRFDARIVKRSSVVKEGSGSHVIVAWSTVRRLAQENMETDFHEE